MFTIGAIGAGHMGIPVLDGLVEGFPVSPSDVLVYELDAERRRQCRARGFFSAGNEQEVYANAEILLLAVPPQAAEELLAKLSRSTQRQVEQKPVIISIMTGISAACIQRHLGEDTPVICVMPTMGMTMGHGAAAIAYTNNVPPPLLAQITQSFATTGEAIVLDEALLKEVVAANGCSPGYAYYFIEAVAKAVAERGVDYDLAVRMAAQGFAGAAAQVLQDEASPATLLSQVCTPGGLTAQGIESLEADNVAYLIGRAVDSSIRRGYALAK